MSIVLCYSTCLCVKDKCLLYTVHFPLFATEQKTTPQGQVYFIHRATGVSTWHDPRFRDVAVDPNELGPLPDGWEVRYTPTVASTLWIISGEPRSSQVHTVCTSNLCVCVCVCLTDSQCTSCYYCMHLLFVIVHYTPEHCSSGCLHFVYFGLEVTIVHSTDSFIIKSCVCLCVFQIQGSLSIYQPLSRQLMPLPRLPPPLPPPPLPPRPPHNWTLLPQAQGVTSYTR